MSIEPQKLGDHELRMLDEDTKDWAIVSAELGRPLTPVQGIVTELYAHILYQEQQIQKLKNGPRRENLDTIWNPEP